MEFGKIINRSFEIAWRYKFLWLFGMFASGGGFYLDINAFMDEDSNPLEFYERITSSPEIIFPLITGFLIWIGVIILLKLLSEIAVIDSVNRIERGGSFSFGIAFSTSLDFFFRYLGLALVKFVSILAIFLVIIFILIFLFSVIPIVGILFMIILIPLGLFLMFVIFNLFSLAERAMIVRNSSILQSIDEGYYLLKNSFSDNFVIFLIFIGLSIVFGIASIIIWLFFGFPIGLAVAAMGFDMMSAFIAAFIFGLPVSLIIGGISGVFFSNLYTLFYFELVEPRQKREFPPTQIYRQNDSPQNPPETV